MDTLCKCGDGNADPEVRGKYRPRPKSRATTRGFFRVAAWASVADASGDTSPGDFLRLSDAIEPTLGHSREESILAHLRLAQ